MKKDIKYVLGSIRRADQDFGLIAPGDRILVGVSGGKDSMTLLECLRRYRMFLHQSFDIVAGTVDMGWGMDMEPIRRLCEGYGIPYAVMPTDIGKLVFEERKEKNPCSLCARMRRGALTNLAKEQGCNKIALGHNREDVLETFLLSMLYEGHIHTFSPLTWLDRSDIVQIRPMLYVPEAKSLGVARTLELPIVKTECPVAGHTKREEMKELLQTLNRFKPDAQRMMLRALQDTQRYDLWDKVKRRPLGNRRGRTGGNGDFLPPDYQTPGECAIISDSTEGEADDDTI
ncbi:MAG: tRNA 2-thiocytidine biosynthesis TtcA family protein [Oscillospiraceae bacterium]|nr:tRNA 2-thiocytidine biosynthesis TtcA family protein [Oscillospiraceae bacterium]